jgi:hypothetical protein
MAAEKLDNDEPKRGFQGVWIPAALWDNPDLTRMERDLLAEIDSLSSAEHGPCHASREFLAKRLHTTPGVIRTMLSELMGKGFIWQLGFDGRSAWRCVAPKYSGNQDKYCAWMQNVRCQPQLTAYLRGQPGLTAEVNPGLPHRSTLVDPEISVENTDKEEEERNSSSLAPPPPPTMALPKMKKEELPLPCNPNPSDLSKIRAERALRENGSLTKVPSAKNGPHDATQRVMMNRELLDMISKEPKYQDLNVRAEACKFKEHCRKHNNPDTEVRFRRWLDRIN